MEGLDRKELHARFVKEFHAGKKSKGCKDADLDKMETSLSTVLPVSYREFMKTHGGVWTPGILDQVTERKLEHVDLQDLHRPSTATKNTKMYWSGGMPDDFVGIGNDCMGSVIGFKRAESKGDRPDDLPVWFFDHDYVEVSQIADGFDDLLKWFLDHLK